MLSSSPGIEELGLRPGHSREQEPVCGCLCCMLLGETLGPKKAALPGELVWEASSLLPGHTASLLSVSRRLYGAEGWSIVRGLSGEL